MRGGVRLAVAAASVLALAVIGSALAASSKRAAKAPIVIGWAFDGNGAMAPFDGPALAAAKLEVNAINAKGGDRPRSARRRTVHRHRPDGPEALRSKGAPRVQLRQRRTRRRLGDGAVRVEPRLADRGARDRHRHR